MMKFRTNIIFEDSGGKQPDLSNRNDVVQSPESGG